MAKEVGIRIKIESTGGEIVIANIQDLENQIRSLETQLKTTDFGSKQYDEIKKVINKLRSELKGITEDIEGLGKQQRFQAIGAAIGVATSSFQALSGAVGLFLSDSESLEDIQKAQAQAFQVLNVVLGINNALLQASEAFKLKDIAITKAQELATKAAAIATRVWNAVLRANPIGLIITGIGLLVAGIYAFTRATKDNTKVITEAQKKQEEYNSIVEKSIEYRDQEYKKIVPLLAISEQENISKEDRNKVIKQIQKTYPDYLKGLDLEKITLQDIKKANDELVESINKTARARAAADSLTKIYTEELDEQSRLQKFILQQEKDLREFLAIDPSPSQIQGVKDRQAAEQILFNVKIENEKKDREIRRKVAQDFITQGNLIDDLTDSTNENTEANKKNIDQYTLNVRKRIQLLNQLKQKQDEVFQNELNYESEILNVQQKVLDEQEDYLNSRTEQFKTAGEKLLDEINNYLFKTIPSEEEAKKLADGYGEFFNIVDNAIKSGKLDFKETTGWSDFVKFAEEQLPGIGEKLVNVNEESRQSFVQYFNSLDERVNIFRKELADNPIISLLGAGELDDVIRLREIESQISRIRATRTESGLTDLQVQQESLDVINRILGIDEKRRKITTEISNIEFQKTQTTDPQLLQNLNDRQTALQDELTAYEGISQSILDSVINTNSFIDGLIQVGILADANKEKIDENKAAIDAAFGPEQIEGIKQYFKGLADQFDVVLQDVFTRPLDYFKKLGEEGVKALFEGLQEGLPNVEGQTRQELEKLSSYLQIVGDELQQSLGLEENPFVKYIEEANKALKKLPTESEEAFTKMVENLNEVASKILQVFTDISGRIQSILSQQTSLLLEQLAYAEEETLATIGEANTNSEKENQKIREEQEKAQKEFAKRRFNIEKQARIQELQFGIANAIATGAQAVIQALALPAPPPAPQLYATFVGGLSAVQVALIRDQLQFTQSKVFIGRRGGLIQGDSHEGGGVPALLEGGEFVLSKPAVDMYGDLIGNLNSSVGGRQLQIDDSRIVQAIASQNTSKTPIKTYVLYNDIQNTEKLNARIQNLAKL